jgi:hypothetical protein
MELASLNKRYIENAQARDVNPNDFYISRYVYISLVFGNDDNKSKPDSRGN